MSVFTSYHNEQILKLDVKQQQPNTIPKFVQYDSALLKIEMYDNGKAYDISRAQDFVVSVKRPDGTTISGLAEYDGEFVNYKLAQQDIEQIGEYQARLQVYEGKNRLSTLSFRYDVYQDFESTGKAEDRTLLSQLLAQVRDMLTETQRQGNYAENRGDYANTSGDYAMQAGESQRMRWLKWVPTIAERNRQYPNPRNGDTVYVVNVDDKNGGAVYRYNRVNTPYRWEEIAGWDTSIVQDIYNLIGALDAQKEDKTKVVELIDGVLDELDSTYFGGTNIIQNTGMLTEQDNVYRGTGGADITFLEQNGQRWVQARQPANVNQFSYFGVTVGSQEGERFTVREGEKLVLSFKAIRSLTSTDMTYVYLMRPNGEGANSRIYPSKKYKVDNTTAHKYEFAFTVPWDSDNAHLLIGTQKAPGYDGEPYWIRVRDIQVERGNRATDWTASIEDLMIPYQRLLDVEIERLNELAQHYSRIDIELQERVPFVEFVDSIQEIRDEIELSGNRTDDVLDEVNNLISRTAAITNNLGEMTERWNFIDTSITMGEEGLLIGNERRQTGLRVADDRIDFLDNGKMVAYISNQQLYINRGLFVDTMQVGSHATQKVNNSVTIVTWVGG